MSCWDREFRTPLARRRWTWPPTCPRCAKKYCDYLAKSYILYSAGCTYNESSGDPANRISVNSLQIKWPAETHLSVSSHQTLACPSTSNNLNGSLWGCSNPTTSYNSAPDIWLGSFRRAGWPNNETLFWLLLPSAILSTRNTSGTFSNLVDERLVQISRLVTRIERKLQLPNRLIISSYNSPWIRFYISLFDGD